MNITDVITFLFFIVLLSYYVLIFTPRKKPPKKHNWKSISVIIPAHNEEEFIADCLRSVMDARWNGKKEVIVVDDGSIDRTAEIVRKFMKKRDGMKFIQSAHSGKSKSINRALKKASGELVAIVDGDSVISRDSLVHMADELSGKGVAGACCVVRVKNRNRFLCMWPHIEQLYNSLMRSILVKVNANVTTPGPLSVYRRKQLEEIGGFSTEGFSEDVDVTIRLIRRGYRIGFSEKAIADTNMPYDVKGVLRQRFRFARGMLNIFRRHLQVNNTWIDIYTLPLLLFGYFQAVIMGGFALYQLITGYITYYASKGAYISYDALMFIFDWISIKGALEWIWSVFTSGDPISFSVLIGVLSTLLSYPLLIYSVIKFDKKIDLFNILPLCFMAPFWWFIDVIYLLSLPEIFAKKQYNIWKKNE